MEVEIHLRNGNVLRTYDKRVETPLALAGLIGGIAAGELRDFLIVGTGALALGDVVVNYESIVAMQMVDPNTEVSP